MRPVFVLCVLLALDASRLVECGHVSVLTRIRGRNRRADGHQSRRHQKSVKMKP
jgi:hypothetical protein